MNTPLDLRALLLDPANNGAYFFDHNDRESLVEAATEAGLHAAPVDFGGCAGKGDALARIAAALRFPEWFGGNWDALADCLGDLSWLDGAGQLLVFDDAWGCANAMARISPPCSTSAARPRRAGRARAGRSGW